MLKYLKYKVLIIIIEISCWAGEFISSLKKNETERKQRKICHWCLVKRNVNTTRKRLIFWRKKCIFWRKLHQSKNYWSIWPFWLIRQKNWQKNFDGLTVCQYDPGGNLTDWQSIKMLFDANFDGKDGPSQSQIFEILI